MKALILVVAITLAPAAHAETLTAPPGVTLQQFFTMTNDRDPTTDKFNLMVDDKSLAAGFLVVPDPKNNDRQDNLYWLKDVEKTDGVVLVEGQGHKVVIMQGQLDRATQEGRFHLQFLANGLSNKYQTCDFLVKKSGALWYAENAYNCQKITDMKIITWSLGLKTLQGVCAQQ